MPETSQTLVSVVGARPNFVKLAPVARALARRPHVRHVVVHTGQHYDTELSDAFFHDLELPRPDHHLAVGSLSHAAQTATVMLRLEPVLRDLVPDMVLVYGDVNSTVAAALAASKLGLPLAHVEAGLRCGHRTMPEEMNRIVTDHLADLLLAPSRDAVQNLRAEGIAAERIHFVGNVMIDTLRAALPIARARAPAARWGLAGRPYGVVTLHRAANVDDPETLRTLVAALRGIAIDLPLIFPMHPRTRQALATIGVQDAALPHIHVVRPLGYVDMLGLVAGARLVVTDSGGLQEETTDLGVPCITVRRSTERPITCREGTNRLTPPHAEAIVLAAREALEQPAVPHALERWDGAAGERVVRVICDARGFTLPHDRAHAAA